MLALSRTLYYWSFSLNSKFIKTYGWIDWLNILLLDRLETGSGTRLNPWLSVTLSCTKEHVDVCNEPMVKRSECLKEYIMSYIYSTWNVHCHVMMCRRFPAHSTGCNNKSPTFYVARTKSNKTVQCFLWWSTEIWKSVINPDRQKVPVETFKEPRQWL